VPNVHIGGMSATGINVSPTVWTTNTTAGQYSFVGQNVLNVQPNNTVHIRGEDADLLINDKSLKTWMEKVEERLNILTPNPEMEAEWDQLRQLGERYRKLEKKCQEKADMWKKLKSMPRPDLP
jgi:putative SOS response-associated peptidase YedK